MSLTDSDPLNYAGTNLGSGSHPSRFTVAATALTAAALADLTTTHIGLSTGLVESNPRGATVLAAAGFLGIIAVKIAASALLLGALTVAETERTEQFALAGCLIIAIVWSAAAGWNIVLILAHGGL